MRGRRYSDGRRSSGITAVAAVLAKDSPPAATPSPVSQELLRTGGLSAWRLPAVRGETVRVVFR